MADMNLNSLIKTEITVTALDQAGNVVHQRVSKNTVTKEGATVLAKLLIDPSAPKPSHIYGRFATNLTDANNDNNLGIALSDVTYNDFVVGAATGKGALRAPLFSTAKLEDNGDVASGKITFFFRLTSSSTLAGTFNPTTSKVFYLGLAAASNTLTASEDLIFSALVSHDGVDGFSIPSGGQMAVDYQLSLSL